MGFLRLLFLWNAPVSVRPSVCKSFGSIARPSTALRNQFDQLTSRRWENGRIVEMMRKDMSMSPESLLPPQASSSEQRSGIGGYLIPLYPYTLIPLYPYTLIPLYPYTLIALTLTLTFALYPYPLPLTLTLTLTLTLALTLAIYPYPLPFTLYPLLFP